MHLGGWASPACCSAAWMSTSCRRWVRVTDEERDDGPLAFSYPTLSVAHPDSVLARFPSRRSVVYSTKGIVAASQPLAVEAGLEILRKGGNAGEPRNLSQLVVTSAALNVSEPSCCGIGGDAFCLFYDAKSKTVKALNGSGHSPRKLTLEYARSRGLTGRAIPLTDLNSVTVPGAAAAWVDTVEQFGSGKVTIGDVLEPAIRLAEEGVPVSELHSLSWRNSEQLIKNASPNGHEMLLNGKAPLSGEIVKLPTLAQTFREDGFYKGRVAEAIVELIQSRGGVMDLEDLAEHKTSFVEPIKYTYANEVTLYECPPNGQGLTALVALGILESLQEQGIVKPLLEMEHNSAEYLHILIEALRLAFADTQWYVADPDLEHVPVESLLSKEYLASRAKLIDPLKTNPEVVHVRYPPIFAEIQRQSSGKPCESLGYSLLHRQIPSKRLNGFRINISLVADQWGNACSYIQSNYAGFGTGAIPKGCGFTLQNRGSGFVLDDSHPNALKGGKRPYHTIIPRYGPARRRAVSQLWCDGRFHAASRPHSSSFKECCEDSHLKQALDSPRFCISAGSPDTQTRETGNAGDINSEVYIEEGIPLETVEKLRAMGHDARRATMGRGQVIQKLADQSGRFVWAAGSDLRADGHAAPQI
ncbi:gamma-glutamyltranspeptidase [Mycena amicta]|nr:gamma-glutamyltranspeptidase [Mycena amicta]